MRLLVTCMKFVVYATNFYASRIGSSTTKVAPPPALASERALPPWCSLIQWCTGAAIANSRHGKCLNVDLLLRQLNGERSLRDALASSDLCEFISDSIRCAAWLKRWPKKATSSLLSALTLADKSLSPQRSKRRCRAPAVASAAR